MERSDIQKLQDFVQKNQFTSYRFRSERQPGYDGSEPISVDLCFRELCTHEFPDVFWLKDENEMIVFDRLKSIRCTKLPTMPIGEIVVVTEKFGFRGKEEKVFRIEAKKIS